jgi:hypothetical protein
MALSRRWKTIPLADPSRRSGAAVRGKGGVRSAWPTWLRIQPAWLLLA